jgi:uncharacterized sulfatase
MRRALKLLALVFGCAAAALPASAAERLNVLYILSDDLNNELGCYGSPIVKTPNLDRLAARAVRFDHAYCNYPVCNASRTSFLSGKRPETTRVVDNVTPPRSTLGDAVMLPEHFKRNGYTTIKVGKIFHTGPQYEDPRSWDLDIVEKGTAKKPPKEQIVREQGKAGIVLHADDADTWDGFVARRAAELLEKAAGDGKPFFVAAGFRRPHTPYIAPEKYYALYQPEKLQPRYGPPEHLAKIPDLALTYRLGEAKFPEKKPGETIAAYYASISFMDAQVGVLLEALDRLKLWDRTVVVFHSDHGYHLGEHGGLWHKMCLFEETTRVPLLVAAPGRAPAVSPRLVELVDVFPSLAEICGLAAPSDLEGRSFVPLLTDPQRPWKSAVFTVVSRGKNIAATKQLDPHYMGRTVLTEQWRYTEWPDGTAELYDHAKDSQEYANLADDPAQTGRLAELKATLAKGWKGALP